MSGGRGDDDLPDDSDDEETFEEMIDRQEEENLEFNQEIPYLYCVSWVLKALIGPGPNPRKVVKWQGKIGEEWLQGQFRTDSLDLELNKAIEKNRLLEPSEITVVVRSSHRKGTRQLISLEELSQELWDAKVETLLKEEHLRYLGYKLDVYAEFYCRPSETIVQKRAYSSIESPMSSPMPRRTRTIQQEERQAEQRNRNEEAGDFSEQLLDRWTCLKDTCINHKAFCFVDYGGQHYSMDNTIRESWAKAISKGNASVEQPPEVLYNF
jgi:hypothetical protein